MVGMRSISKYATLALMLIWLNGCSTTQPSIKPAVPNTTHFEQLANIQSFKLKGRIGIQMPGQGYSGSFHWRHLANNTDEISFFSPVGSQVAKITQTPTQATLTDNKGNTYEATNATTLIHEHLGWQIPVNDLNDWLLARAKADSQTTLSLDSLGRLIQLKKLDWSIQYANYRTWDHTDLPGKIKLSKPSFSLKLVIQDWQIKP